MKTRRFISILLILLMWICTADAQKILSRNIPSFQVNRQRLGDVLEILSNKGNFYFSYNSAIIRQDSLVTITAYNKSVKQILDYLFNASYEYRESGNYLILRRAPMQVTLITNKAVTEEKFYSVTGYVLDDATGEVVNEASIYEKQRLVATLTDQQGFFKIRLKTKFKRAALTVSKELYEDTTVIINPAQDQQISISIVPVDPAGTTVTISPEDYITPDTAKLLVTNDSAFHAEPPRQDSVKVERTRMGKLLISARQKAQSVNLKKFFTARPYQLSFIPGFGTNGKMNAQVINHVSINALGGYAGGVDGAEVGGLFTINKKDVQYFQAGGLFNLVGGKMKGAQFAGLHNSVLDDVSGFQAAGISNYVHGRFEGVQVSGIYNHITDTVSGVQISGIANYNNKGLTGWQVSGIGNFSRQRVNGVQIAGIFNYAKVLHGTQIGLINVADSSDGLSLGLINIVLKNGYHKLALSTNELMNVNLDISTGSRNLYTVLSAGAHASDSARLYAFGLGLGHDFIFNPRLSLSAVWSVQYLYLGSFDYTNLLNRLKLNCNLRLNKYISIFAGPVLNVYQSNQSAAIKGYRHPLHHGNYSTVNLANNLHGWIGWNAGISLF